MRLTAEGVCPTCSAAAEIEPHSITQTKICNSSDLAFTGVLFEIAKIAAFGSSYIEIISL